MPDAGHSLALRPQPARPGGRPPADRYCLEPPLRRKRELKQLVPAGLHIIGDLRFGPKGRSSPAAAARARTHHQSRRLWPVRLAARDQRGYLAEEGGSLRSQDLRRRPRHDHRPRRPDRGRPHTAPLAGIHHRDSLDVNERRIVAYGFRNLFRFAIDAEREEVFVKTTSATGPGGDRRVGDRCRRRHRPALLRRRRPNRPSKPPPLPLRALYVNPNVSEPVLLQPLRPATPGLHPPARARARACVCAGDHRFDDYRGGGFRGAQVGHAPGPSPTAPAAALTISPGRWGSGTRPGHRPALPQRRRPHTGADIEMGAEGLHHLSLYGDEKERCTG